MKSKATQACAECGGEMRYEKHPDELTCLGHVRALETGAGEGVPQTSTGQATRGG